jgi:hypothetical protein
MDHAALLGRLALTASDRPCQVGLPAERALDAIAGGVMRGEVDGSLLGVILEARPWQATAPT